jgi:hypothetical protein
MSRSQRDAESTKHRGRAFARVMKINFVAVRANIDGHHGATGRAGSI